MEVIEPMGNKLTTKVDSYSFGKILYEMLAKNSSSQVLANRLFYESEPPAFLPEGKEKAKHEKNNKK